MEYQYPTSHFSRVHVFYSVPLENMASSLSSQDEANPLLYTGQEYAIVPALDYARFS